MGTVISFPRIPLGLNDVPVSFLRPHPKNPAIYGDTADQKLLDSVRERGIQERLRITADGTIISGHRRWDAAKRLGLVEVPVEVSPLTDDLDILESLIHSNIGGRVKTNEQFVQETAALMEIEAERARRRMLAGVRANPGLMINPGLALETGTPDIPNGGGGTAGRADEKVAEKVGAGATKVRQAVALNQAIEQLRDDGRSDDADELRAELNDASVNAAYQLGKERGWITTERRPRKGPDVGDIGNTTRKLMALALGSGPAPSVVASHPSAGRRITIPEDVERAAEVIQEHFDAEWIAALGALLFPSRLPPAQPRRPRPRPIRASAPQEGTQEGRILAAIKEHGELSTLDLVRITGVPGPSVSSRLHHLFLSGRVSRTGEMRGQAYVYAPGPAE